MSDPQPPIQSPHADPPAAPSDRRLMIVGIGASAGGLAALKQLLPKCRPGIGVAYVIVVHLSPERESHLAELLQPVCPLPVQQVTEDVKLAPDQVYVIPPGANLNTIDTHLRLTPLERARRQRAPIDHFLRTLAETHDGDSIAIILTGTGSDGTLGMRRIKEAGGLTIAQDPAEAEHDAMPRSAIASGMIDRVLRLDEIPDEVATFATARPQLPRSGAKTFAESDQNRILQRIFAQIRSRSGHDFAHYKRSTVLRRIARRMQLHGVESLEQYLSVLRVRHSEVDQLFDDLLITVTEFFRDHRVFDYLQGEIIPHLFEGKTSEHRLRVWSVGCSTGEEAYSLAMLLTEEAGRRDIHPQIQVFASDLHQASLTQAREGIYPEEIAVDISPERLQRFFVRENGHYRVRREIRELVVFAPHNLLRDPPFSHLDLIVCRNLLIYLQRDIQQDVLSLFHYALEPGGYLLLGSSESTDNSELFSCESKENCVFRRRNVPLRHPNLPGFLARAGPSYPATAPENGPGEPGERDVAILSYGAMHERVVERYAPPSLLLNSNHEIVHTSVNAGRYLAVPGGEPTRNAFKLLREPLGIELRAALLAAREQGRAAASKPLRLTLEGEQAWVTLRVQSASDPDLAGFLLVTFDESAAEPSNQPIAPKDASSTVRELQAELELYRQRFRAVVEEHETSREEMQASNEELQSANEELRSTMEELETSKEELQSMNEELTTVNQENRHRVEELAQLSSDLQNLLTATDIATLFLDRDLRIVRFTPRVGDHFNVRRTDIGRPLSDLTHRLGYPDLQEDARQVLYSLQSTEREVQSDTGQSLLARLLPYRGAGDRIEGVVLTLIDITDRRTAELRVRESEERLRRMINVSGVGVLIFDANATRLIDANAGFCEITGYSLEQIRTGAVDWRALTPPEHVAASEAQLEQLAATGTIGPYEKEYFCADGSRRWLLFAGASLGDGTIVEYCIDISDRKAAETALADAKEYAENIFETLHEPLLILRPDLTVIRCNPAFFSTFQVQPEDTIDRKIYDLGNGQWDIPALRKLLEDVLPRNNIFNDYEVAHQFRDIGRRCMLLNARRLDHVQLILLGIRDITEKKQAEDRMRLVMSELNHRVKNTLATIDAIASQSLDQADSLDAFRETFRRRLRSMSAAHSLLTRTEWTGADLDEILRTELEPRVAAPDHLLLAGPAVTIQPRAALGLHMAIHELATNAAKYGALSVAEGRVEVHWSIATRDEKPFLDLHWRESDGPPVNEPAHRSFGAELIDGVIEYELGGQVQREFAADGLRCAFQIPAEGIIVPDDQAATRRRRSARTKPTPTPGPAAARGARRVLIVEDSPAVARLLVRVLEAAGHTVLGPAGGLDSARQLIEAESFDAALLDFDLNGQRADPLAELLRTRNIPFAFVTAFNQSDLDPAWASVPVFTKPINASAIADWLQSAP